MSSQNVINKTNEQDKLSCLRISRMKTAHLVWHDWMQFWIVCPLCHQNMVSDQWRGDGGSTWTQQQKTERKLLARLAQYSASTCQHCGCEIEGCTPLRELTRQDELQWRYGLGERHFARLAMTGLDLSGLDLNQVELTEANLNGTTFAESSLQGAKLRGTSLIGADLNRARLNGADLSGADLIGANLQGANLAGADLVGVDLRGAALVWANLQGARLRGALLQGASLRGAQLKGAIMPDGNVQA